MSQPVKLAGTLPAGDANGLAAIAADAADDPRQLRVVIAIVDCKELRTSVDVGDVVPVLRIKRIEALAPEDLKAGRQLWRRAHERRTGRQSLPIDLEEQIEEAFGADQADH
jgi:hypothetical protein